MKFWFLGVICFAGILSCSNDASEIGSSLVETRARTILIDTCTVTLTTVKIDSLVTSGRSILYSGQFSNQFRGVVSATSHLSFLAPSYVEHRKNITTTPLQLDSMVLLMGYSQNYYGDTLNRQGIAIHILENGLELPISEAYYNTSRVNYNPNPLVQIDFAPRPNRGEQLRVRLPESMGEDLLTRLSTNDDNITTNERFLDLFPGFAIVPHENNTAIMGFNVAGENTQIKLYYHFVEEKKEEHSISLSPDTTTCFYSIDHNRTGTPVENIVDGYHGIASSRSNNMAYIFGLIGYYTRIEFPYLRELLKIGNAGDIVSAELLLYPVRDSHNDQYPLPNSLNLYVADETNSTVDAITNAYGTDLQTGNLVNDELYNVNTYYSFTISSFLRQQLPAIGINKQKLHLVLPETDMNGTFNSVIFGDHLHPDQRIKVNIIYSLYE